MSHIGPHHRVGDDAVRRAILDARLYGILDMGYVAQQFAEAMATRLVTAGVQILQLRAKHLDPGTLLPLARSIATICRSHRVPFILNDHPELVSAAGADGVHVGQDDLSVSDARRLAGSWAVVGKSTHSVDQAMAAAAEGADYIGYGPLFSTPTKPDYVPVGLDSVRQVHDEINIPVFCIGGIKRENLVDVMTAGAHRVVIVSGLLHAEDVAGMVLDCRNLLGIPACDTGGSSAND